MNKISIKKTAHYLDSINDHNQQIKGWWYVIEILDKYRNDFKRMPSYQQKRIDDCILSEVKKLDLCAH